MVSVKIMPNLDVKVSYDPAWVLKITPEAGTGTGWVSKKGGK